jgi:hypothetical protein
MAARPKRRGSLTAARKSPPDAGTESPIVSIASCVSIRNSPPSQPQATASGIALSCQYAHNTLWIERSSSTARCDAQWTDARGPGSGEFAMTDDSHKFKVGQTVDLVPSTLRPAANGSYVIVSLRSAEDGSTSYRIKSEREAHERVVSESDLALSKN